MTCRVDEGGSPQCKLGEGCKSVEIRGKSLLSISKSRLSRSPYTDRNDLKREYDLFIVLESPSFLDDKLGYIGCDDKLNQIYELVLKTGFDKDKVFIAPLTRCFAFKSNPQPTIQNIKTCQPYILKEIELTKPKVIMLLGAKTLRLFNLHNKGGMNSVRGKVFKVEVGDREIDVVPSYSPGYLEYVPDPTLVINRIKDDYALAYSLANNTPHQTDTILPDYQVLTSVDQVENLCTSLKGKFFAFDTESRGLPYTKEPLICLSISRDGDTCAIIPFYQHDPDGLDWKLKKFWSDSDLERVKNSLRTLFEDPSTDKAAHNISYDINVIRKHLGIKFQGFAFDSMLMHHILIEQKPHDLEYLADLEFKTGQYSSGLYDIIGKSGDMTTFDNIPDEVMYPYTAIDAKSCYKLTRLYFNRLTAQPHLWKLYTEETEPLIHAITDAVWNGHYIDQSLLKTLVDDTTQEKEDILKEVRSLTWEGFNPASVVHVQQALIQLGFTEEIRDSSKASGFNTGKENLLKLKFETPVADLTLKYRNTNKILGTYLENLKKDLDSDGRVRYSWMIHGTESGRLSCRFYHQIPRADKKKKTNLRDMLAVPPGRKMIYMDFNQIELRVLALVSGDDEMLRMFASGEDLHRATAAVMLGIPEVEVSEYNRQLGKNTNFGLAYGSEGYRLVATNSWQDDRGVVYPFTWDMFNQGMERFRERFPKLTTYLESVPGVARVNGNIFRTQFGRERRMGNKLNDRNIGTRKAAERELVNFTIQSVAGAITVRTISLIHKYIESWRRTGKLKENELFLINTVHDSGAWEVIEHFAMPFARILKQTAERKIPELDDYSFPCAIGIGDNWTQAEKNKITQW